MNRGKNQQNFKKMNNFLTTPTERARGEKHRKICAMYLDLTNKQPHAAPHRIFYAIAQAHGMTVPGVRNIIIQNGLYVKK
jgi:hypothetical protein